MICIECSDRYLGYDDDDTMSSNEIGTCPNCLETEEMERAEELNDLRREANSIYLVRCNPHPHVDAQSIFVYYSHAVHGSQQIRIRRSEILGSTPGGIIVTRAGAADARSFNPHYTSIIVASREDNSEEAV